MQLWKHQQEAVTLAEHRDYFAFLMEAGTGKTLATIECLRYKFNKAKTVLPTLVLCPVIVIENWADELRRFTAIPHAQILPLHGPVKNRIAQFNTAMNKYNGHFIAITNYEGIVSAKRFYELLYNWAPNILVCDESHKLKSPSSARTKLVTRLADKAECKYLLSGTPILNSPLDIFSQWRIMDGGERFGKNFFTFRAKYFFDKNGWMPKQSYFPNWVIRPESYEQISKELAKDSFRAIKAECLDLPPVVTKTIKVELTAPQRKAYNELEKLFVTYMGDQAVSTDLALTKLLRMLQIVTGFVKTDDGEIITYDDTPRQAALKEILEEISEDHKVIIWCVFKENYRQVRQVCEAMGIRYVEAHGEISAKKKYEAVDAFNNDDSIRVFIGHPASLGIGINLIGASYSIRYSRGYNYGDYEQSNARNYRGGSEIHEKITRIELLAKDTLEEVIVQALEQKISNADALLEYIRRGI